MMFFLDFLQIGLPA